MTERHRHALATAIDHLDWFKIPHTADQIVGLYAESTSELRGTTTRARTNDEMVDGIRAATNAAGFGKGGHSDPTPAAALRGEPDAVDDDETLGVIDAALTDLEQAATALDHAVMDAVGKPRWHPPYRPGRQEQVATAVVRLHHCTSDLTEALERMDSEARRDCDDYLLVRVTDQARWLSEKGQAIWQSARGERRTTATQAPGERPKECTCCAGHGITGTLAVTEGLCANCSRFQSDEKCLPDQRICRAWDRGARSIPNGWKIEAKAKARVKPGRSRAS